MQTNGRPLPFPEGKGSGVRSDPLKLDESLRLWGEAERGYRELAQAFSDTEAAPEALYWSAASAYKLTGNVAVFPVAASKLRHRYPQSIWTRKASVWL